MSHESNQHIVNNKTNGQKYNLKQKKSSRDGKERFTKGKFNKKKNNTSNFNNRDTRPIGKQFGSNVKNKRR